MEKDEEEKKSILAEWIQMTGWHGILDCYIASHFIWKVIWLLVILAGAFIAIVQCFYMIDDYTTEDQLVTSISYETPPEGRLPWPNMSICMSTLPRAQSSLYTVYIENGLPLPVEEVTKQAENSQGITTTQANIQNLKVEETNRSSIGGNQTTNQAPVITPCQSMVAECGTADKNDRFPIIDISKKQSGPISRPAHIQKCCMNETRIDSRCFGLNLEAIMGHRRNDLGTNAYYIFQNADAQIGYEVNLFMGNLEDIANMFSVTTKFFVAPGTRNVISMVSEIHRIKQLNRIINFGIMDLPCASDPAAYQYLSENRYTKSFCALDCIVQWDMKFCNCTENLQGDGIATKRRTPVCATDQELECKNKYVLSLEQLRKYANYDKNVITDEMVETSKCLYACPEPCKFGRIEAQISSQLFLSPNEIRLANIQFNTSAEVLKQLTMVEMYYSMGQHRIYETSQRLTIDEFIGNIGGCMGVWSGISFLSIVQILYYVAKGVLSRIGERDPKRKTSAEQQQEEDPPCYVEDMKGGAHYPPVIY